VFKKEMDQLIKRVIKFTPKKYGQDLIL